jgi:hypothetical protein
MDSEETDMRDAIWILAPVVIILLFLGIKLFIDTWRDLWR